MIGFIYYLQNPVTKEVFYVGATKVGLLPRLRTHYIHLGDAMKGTRNWNRRFRYLQALLPNKAEIHLIEIIEDMSMLDMTETAYIRELKRQGAPLLNETDGGKGGNTCKYLESSRRAQMRYRLRKSLQGRAKPEGFAAALSKARMGANNPQAGKMKWPPIVAFLNGEPMRMFRFSYEVRQFSGSTSLHGNIIKMLTGRQRRYKPHGYDWVFLKDCDQAIQDIVQSRYESASQEGEVVPPGVNS